MKLNSNNNYIFHSQSEQGDDQLFTQYIVIKNLLHYRQCYRNWAFSSAQVRLSVSSQEVYTLADNEKKKEMKEWKKNCQVKISGKCYRFDCWNWKWDKKVRFKIYRSEKCQWDSLTKLVTEGMQKSRWLYLEMCVCVH